MRRWRHLLCGVITAFPNGVDPNAQQRPCPSCQVAIGGWEQVGGNALLRALAEASGGELVEIQPGMFYESRIPRTD